MPPFNGKPRLTPLCESMNSILKSALLVSALVLAACSTSGKPPSNRDTDEPKLNGKTIQHTSEEAEQFIQRFPSMTTGLLNYIANDKVELIEREFSAETVIFKLDSTGDTGPFHEVALERAIELMDMYGWPEEAIASEWAPESHLAVVKVESIGIPAGTRPGDTIPVKIFPKGDATELRGGYVYTTPLRDKRGKTVGVLSRGFLPLLPEDAKTEKQKEESKDMTKLTGTGRTEYVLRGRVTIARKVGIDELTADKIIMPVTRDVFDETGKYLKTVRMLSSELMPDVLTSIEKEMEEAGVPVKAEAGRDENVNAIVVTPLGVREHSLRQIYERLRTVRVTVNPRTNVVIVFDEDRHRVVFYGPVATRFLIGDVALTTDPFTRNKTDVEPHQLRFRVSVRVLERADPGSTRHYGIPRADGTKTDGSKGRVNLAWSRRNADGDIVDEGNEEFDSADITDILRHLWTRGMSPREVLGFCVDAKENFAIAAELGLNLRQLDLEELENGN